MVSGSREPGCRRAERGIWAILAILPVWIVAGRLGRSPIGGDGFSCSRELLPSSGYWCGVAHRKTRPASRPGRRRPHRRRALLSRSHPALHRRRRAQQLRPGRRLRHGRRLNHGRPLSRGRRLRHGRKPRRGRRPRHGRREQSTRAFGHIRLAAAARPATWSSPSWGASSPTSSRRSRGSRSMWSTPGRGHAPSMLALDPSGW
jgi:hypothetical protein